MNSRKQLWGGVQQTRACADFLCQLSLVLFPLRGGCCKTARARVKYMEYTQCFTSAASPPPKGNTCHPCALFKEHLRNKAKVTCSYTLQPTASLGEDELGKATRPTDLTRCQLHPPETERLYPTHPRGLHYCFTSPSKQKFISKLTINFGKLESLRFWS